MSQQVHTKIADLGSAIQNFKEKTKVTKRTNGIVGFDGFVDSFIRFETPSTMAELGPKITAAAGIAASYFVKSQGEKFGGNGPLLANGLHDILSGEVGISYIGGIGNDKALPIYENALGAKMKLYTIAPSAVTTCLEFTDGKIMLNDLGPCAEITWDRLIERVGADKVDELVKGADFVAAVNWGKLANVGSIWKNLAARHKALGLPAKKLLFFMDLAEFEQREEADRNEVIKIVAEITEHCNTILSLNLKEAWQLADSFKGDYHGQKEPAQVAALAAFLRSKVTVDRIIIHPNDGAACASATGSVYVPGPHCKEPLISTGAGDNFGAGCVAAALHGLDDTGILLAGNCASGHFVRCGHPASFADMASMLDLWTAGTLGERLPVPDRVRSRL